MKFSFNLHETNTRTLKHSLGTYQATSLVENGLKVDLKIEECFSIPVLIAYSRYIRIKAFVGFK